MNSSNLLNLLDYNEFIIEKKEQLKKEFHFDNMYLYLKNTFKNQEIYSFCTVEDKSESAEINRCIMNFNSKEKMDVDEEYKFENFTFKLVDDSENFVFEKSKFEIYIELNNYSKYREAPFGFVVFSFTKDKKHHDIKSLIKENSQLEIFLKELVVFKYQLLSYCKIYESIDQFTEILKLKYHYMPYHMSNVANLAIEMSNKLNLDSYSVLNLYFASIIHDVGKIYISDDILNKPDKLTNEEFDVVKTHSELSCTIAKTIFCGTDDLVDVPLFVRHHHERFDGRGYPDGLVKDEIPFLSQIIGICDAVDAMRSNKPYAGAGSFEEIVKELKKCSGSQFNPKLVDVMIDVLMEVYDNKYYLDIEKLKYIPNTSLNFIDKKTNTHHSVMGTFNFIVGKAKFIIKNKEIMDSIKSIEKLSEAKISYIYMDNLYEYHVDINAIEDDEISLSNLIKIPGDQLFSVNWVVKGNLMIEMKTIPIMIFRIGAKGLAFKMDSAIGSQILKYNVSEGKVQFKLELEGMVDIYKLEVKIIRYYLFNNDYRFVLEYVNIPEKDRDTLFKYLFRKQIKEKMITQKGHS
ncbi:MAG: HD domain-containing protein [Clostridiales bacterium]|nr:HD domain-containing protein [Clostridiales bacterium]